MVGQRLIEQVIHTDPHDIDARVRRSVRGRRERKTGNATGKGVVRCDPIEFQRSNSGSLAMLAAIRRASSRVSSLAAARRPGSFSK